MHNQSFYRVFEDRYRGSRELIKRRLSVYQPFINALKQANGENCTALDIGCGRGEWLELLAEQGLKAKGIDLDHGMLQACFERGLDVEHNDGIARLTELESDSIDLISAFHLVEHLSFQQLKTLIEQAYRVLTPSGLLILETPNPENLVVASSSFYMDPTHIKPIPPDLLAFVTEYAGFIQNKIMRLQEPKTSSTTLKLYDVINNVSPDYAVVAQKIADTPKLRHFVAVFSQNYGISLNDMLHQYDEQLLSLQQTKIDAENQLKQTEATLSSILQSKSWRLTQPLRTLNNLIKSIKFKSVELSFIPVKQSLKKIVRRLLIELKHTLAKSPMLKKWITKCLQSFPSLAGKVYNLFHRLERNQFTAQPRLNTGNTVHLSPYTKQLTKKLKQ